MGYGLVAVPWKFFKKSFYQKRLSQQYFSLQNTDEKLTNDMNKLAKLTLTISELYVSAELKCFSDIVQKKSEELKREHPDVTSNAYELK